MAPDSECQVCDGRYAKCGGEVPRFKIKSPRPASPARFVRDSKSPLSRPQEIQQILLLRRCQGAVFLDGQNCFRPTPDVCKDRPDEVGRAAIVEEEQPLPRVPTEARRGTALDRPLPVFESGNGQMVLKTLSFGGACRSQKVAGHQVIALRSSRRSILPDAVLGMVSRKWISRGCL